jgi:HEAT repeat protein
MAAVAARVTMRPLLLLCLLSSCVRATRDFDVEPGVGDRRNEGATGVRAQLELGAASLDPQVRRAALEHLTGAASPEERPAWIARAAWDPDPWVNQGAVALLRAQPADSSSTPALQAMVAREGLDGVVRCTAALVLAERGDVSTLALVQQVWADEPESFRSVTCALAAARMGDPGGITGLAESFAEGEELPMETAFYRELGASGLTSLAAPLAAAGELVEEPAQVGLAVAVLGLDGAIGTPLVRELINAGDEMRRLEIIDRLLMSGSPEAPDLLRKVAAAGPDAVRTYARLALVARGEGAPDQLLEAASSTDREVRLAAARCAGLAVVHAKTEGGEPSRSLENAVAKTLSLAARDDEGAVRLVALQAAAAAGFGPTPERLAELLADDDEQIRVAAAGAALAIAPSS